MKNEQNIQVEGHLDLKDFLQNRKDLNDIISHSIESGNISSVNLNPTHTNDYSNNQDNHYNQGIEQEQIQLSESLLNRRKAEKSQSQSTPSSKSKKSFK